MNTNCRKRFETIIERGYGHQNCTRFNIFVEKLPTLQLFRPVVEKLKDIV